MRVTHVYKDYFPPVFGGIEQHLNALCGGLVKRGVDVRVVVASQGARTSREDHGGVSVVRVGCLGRLASAPLSPLFPLWIRRMNDATDVFHFHFPNPAGELSVLLGMVRRPFVVTYHSDIVRQRHVMPVYGAVVRRFLARASRVVVASPNHVAMSPFLRAVEARCVVIPYGIDPAWLRPAATAAASRDRWRARLGERVVLFVGRFRHYKGLDVLLSAMSRVQATLALVGAGPSESSLREQVRWRGLESRVTFLGHLDDEDLRGLYHACDVFVLPSTNKAEAFGLVQLEAMACGRPVVSTELGTGTTFVNQHGLTGLVVPPNDVHALAGAIQRLLADRPLAAKLGEAGRARVATDFTLDRMVDRTLSLYTDVAAATPSAPSTQTPGRVDLAGVSASA